MAAAGKEVNRSGSKTVARERRDRERADKEIRRDAPNPVWFKPVMFGFMLLGLIWIVLFYITSPTPLTLPVPMFGQANLFVGFGLVLVGFLMTPWWK